VFSPSSGSLLISAGLIPFGIPSVLFIALLGGLFICLRRGKENIRQEKLGFCEKIGKRNQLILEDRFKSFMNASSELAFLKGHNRRYITANKAFCEILDMTEQEVLGKRDEDLVGWELAEEFLQYDNEILHKGGSISYEGPGLKEGYYETRKFAVPLLTGEIGIGRIVRDITGRKKMEQELKESLEEKEILLQELHHRVKNNMQLIASLLNIEKKQYSCNAECNALSESRRRIHSIALVHEMLYSSSSLAKIDFRDYLMQLIGELYNNFSEARKRIEVEIKFKDLILNINASVPLGLMANEIISNIFKHAFPDKRSGSVEILAEKTSDELILSIADTGIGMSEDIDIDSDYVGMLIIKSLVDQLAGKVWIEREQGTRFIIALPLTILY
jgi:PAS domain S-box-containing protein